jgi:hypothetical protein
MKFAHRRLWNFLAAPESSSPIPSTCAWPWMRPASHGFKAVALTSGAEAARRAGKFGCGQAKASLQETWASTYKARVRKPDH